MAPRGGAGANQRGKRVIICRRCGHSNQSTETFCRSCGAFLKWDGERVETAPDDSLRPAGESGPEGDTGPVEVPPDPDLSVSCPACGRLNERDRTFCRTCGERLVPQRVERVVVAEPARPRRWGGSALVGGVAVVSAIAVIAALGLRSTGIVGTSQTPSASTAQGEASPPRATPTHAPTPTPEPIELAIVSVKASSFPNGPASQPDRYAPDQAIDGSLDTSWQEGASEEAGEWIEVEIVPATLGHLVLFNGWQWKDDAFYANRRLRDIQVLVDGAEAATATLEDTTGPQTVDLGGARGASIRIVIVTTYDSEARPKFSAKSPFDDAALSEIQVFGTPGK